MGDAKATSKGILKCFVSRSGGANSRERLKGNRNPFYKSPPTNNIKQDKHANDQSGERKHCDKTPPRRPVVDAIIRRLFGFVSHPIPLGAFKPSECLTNLFREVLAAILFLRDGFLNPNFMASYKELY
jgi:hypothetical protein